MHPEMRRGEDFAKLSGGAGLIVFGLNHFRRPPSSSLPASLLSLSCVTYTELLNTRLRSRAAVGRASLTSCPQSPPPPLLMEQPPRTLPPALPRPLAAPNTPEEILGCRAPPFPASNEPRRGPAVGGKASTRRGWEGLYFGSSTRSPVGLRHCYFFFPTLTVF